MKLDWTLVPWKGLEVVAQTMAKNDASHGSVWKTTSREEHLKAMMRHMAAVMQGDTSEDHLAHATTRGLMAMACDEVGVKKPPAWCPDPFVTGRLIHHNGYVEKVNDEWVAMLTTKASVPRQRFGDDTVPSLEAAMRWVERGGK